MSDIVAFTVSWIIACIGLICGVSYIYSDLKLISTLRAEYSSEDHKKSLFYENMRTRMYILLLCCSVIVLMTPILIPLENHSNFIILPTPYIVVLIPFIIISGYRTLYYDNKVKHEIAKMKQHLDGDISSLESKQYIFPVIQLAILEGNQRAKAVVDFYLSQENQTGEFSGNAFLNGENAI